MSCVRYHGDARGRHRKRTEFRFNGDISTGANRDAEVRVSQSRRIIDAVPDRGREFSLTLRLGLANAVGFVLRKDLGKDALDPHLFCHGISSAAAPAADSAGLWTSRYGCRRCAVRGGIHRA